MKPISALRRAAAVLLACLPLAAAAATLSLDGSSGERTVQSLRALVDADGTLGLPDVRTPASAARWQEIDTARQAANFGLTTATVWFAIPVEAGPGGDGRWLLTVAFPTLDRVEVYVGDGATAPLAGGDLLPFALRAVPHRHHVFPIDLSPGEAKTLFVRVRSEGNLTTPLTFWRAEALWASDHGTYAALGLYFGILAALLLYNGLMFLSLRDPLYLLYIAFVATMGLAQLANTGLGNEFLWPGSPRWGNDAMMIGMSTTGIFASLFVRRFLAMESHSRAIDRAILGTGVLFATALVLTLAVSYRWGAYVINGGSLSFALPRGGGRDPQRMAAPARRRLLPARLDAAAGGHRPARRAQRGARAEQRLHAKRVPLRLRIRDAAAFLRAREPRGPVAPGTRALGRGGARSQAVARDLVAGQRAASRGARPRAHPRPAGRQRAPARPGARPGPPGPPRRAHGSRQPAPSRGGLPAGGGALAPDEERLRRPPGGPGRLPGPERSPRPRPRRPRAGRRGRSTARLRAGGRPCGAPGRRRLRGARGEPGFVLGRGIGRAEDRACHRAAHRGRRGDPARLGEHRHRLLPGARRGRGDPASPRGGRDGSRAAARAGPVEPRRSPQARTPPRAGPRPTGMRPPRGRCSPGRKTTRSLRRPVAPRPRRSSPGPRPNA
ncbi:MAG: hypothetical protein IPL06_23045 [Betaproteobacteria bacterium]|nr:hypothetical protein [Betaproteobacteria bacterium]